MRKKTKDGGWTKENSSQTGNLKPKIVLHDFRRII
jgi:hypothetical protein